MTSIIDDLQNPGSLTDRTDNVSVVQTHISIVFIADEFVYKIKIEKWGHLLLTHVR